VQNSLVAFAIGHYLGLNPRLLAEGLAKFKGVGRRCEVIGSVNRKTIMSDYAHHPAEIKATLVGLETYLQSPVHVVYQPHRYSRTQSCWDQFLTAFEGACSVTLIDIYSAGESELADISSSRLASELRHPNASYCANRKQLLDRLEQVAQAGELVVFMGAGDIDGLARELVTAEHSQ
jgi:UDP-N-acetylmuramate--alanine ligase